MSTKITIYSCRVSMCPVSVFAKDPDCENEQSHSDLRDRWR